MAVHPIQRVLIAYDGSPSAATAVVAAAGLFPGAHAYVGTVPPDTAVRTGTALPVLPTMSPDAVQRAIDELGAEAARQASETAQQGSC